MHADAFCGELNLWELRLGDLWQHSHKIWQIITIPLRVEEID